MDIVKEPVLDIEEPASALLLQPLPSGAFALAGAAVALLLVAWLVMYFFTFLPRGPVG